MNGDGSVDGVKGLSRLQREILVTLLAAELNGESDEDWGTRWPWARSSRSQLAAVSRAARRLENRGLIKRRNRCTGDQYCSASGRKHVRPHPRTTHLLLADAGRAVAQRLLEEDDRNG
jgi:hypothetical protein